MVTLDIADFHFGSHYHLVEPKDYEIENLKVQFNIYRFKHIIVKL